MGEILYQSAFGLYVLMAAAVLCAHPLLVVLEKLSGQTRPPKYTVGRNRSCSPSSETTAD